MEGFERLESLLVTQSYDELSAADQNWLLEQGITKTEYERQAETLQAAKDLFRTDVAVPPAALRYRLAEQQQIRATKLRTQRRVRIVGLAAAFLLGLSLGWGIFGTSTLIKSEMVTTAAPKEVRMLKDTVYVDRVVYEPAAPKVIYRDRLVRDTVFVTPVASVTQEELQQQVLTVTQPDEVPGFSRNAQETEQLLKLVVEVY